MVVWLEILVNMEGESHGHRYVAELSKLYNNWACMDIFWESVVHVFTSVQESNRDMDWGGGFLEISQMLHKSCILISWLQLKYVLTGKEFLARELIIEKKDVCFTFKLSGRDVGEKENVTIPMSLAFEIVNVSAPVMNYAHRACITNDQNFLRGICANCTYMKWLCDLVLRQFLNVGLQVHLKQHFVFITYPVIQHVLFLNKLFHFSRLFSK